MNQIKNTIWNPDGDPSIQTILSFDNRIFIEKIMRWKMWAAIAHNWWTTKPQQNMYLANLMMLFSSQHG